LSRHDRRQRRRSAAGRQAPLRQSPQPVQSGQVPSRPVTVLTYNIQGAGALVSRRYLDAITRVIEQVQPDLVGLQEVHRGTWPARFEDQVEELARRTGMEPWFGTTVSLGTGDHGNAVLARGKILGGEVTVLPGRMERRSLLTCQVELDDAKLDFMVTHLAAWGRLARTSRSRQAEFIRRRLAQATAPTVLVGDFNAPPTAPELGSFLADEEVQICGSPEEATHRFMRQRIDYICTCRAWDAVESRVLRTGPSDHFPVTAKLRLRPEDGGAAQVASELAAEPVAVAS